MNRALFRSTLRERFSSVVTIVVMALFTFVVPLALGLDNGPIASAEGLTGVLVPLLFLSAGVIGRDVSSGTLALVFTRPLRRSDYLLTKWLAISSLAAGVSIAQLLTQATVLALRHRGESWTHLWQNAVERVVFSFALASVLILLSTLVARGWNIALWAGGPLLLTILASVRGLQPVTTAAVPIFVPRINVWQAFYATPISWFAITSVLSTITLALALSVWVMNRKELSYASG
jgi:ABC-type transport system involved in multi-copper enzyme maturation permease subunit